MKQLCEFLESKATIPNDPDQAFVLQYETCNMYEQDDNNEHDDDNDENWFRFFISTKRLLENAIKSDFLQADRTYKIFYYGYPLLVVGTSDKSKKFHLIGRYRSFSKFKTNYIVVVK